MGKFTSKDEDEDAVENCEKNPYMDTPDLKVPQN